MKYFMIAFLALFTIQTQAQKSKIEGEWLLKSIQNIEENKIEEVAQILNFDPSGTIFIQEMPFGTWSYSKKKLSIDAQKIPGEYKITTLSKNELELALDNKILYFTKINRSKLIEANKNSQLIGVWKVESGVSHQKAQILSFNAPDQVLLIEEDEGMKNKSSGIWFFKKKNSELLILGHIENFSGISHILSISDNELILKNSNGEFILKKETQSNKVERLQFTEEEFYDENGQFLYDADQDNLPWKEYDKMYTSLINVEKLVYQFDALEENTNTFNSSILTALVSINTDDESFKVDNIFNGYDRFSIEENQEFPENNYEPYNILYPLNENTFRIVGEENIEVPAGNFLCVVFEVLGDFDELQKIYFIKNKPGIVAKVITDKPGMFGHFSIFQLKEIIPSTKLNN